MISNKPGYAETAAINALFGSLSFSLLPYTVSLTDHKNPLSDDINDEIYCASSTSIPFGYSSDL